MPKGVKQSVFEPCWWDQTVPAIKATNCTENLHLCAAVPRKTSVTSEHNNMIIQQARVKKLKMCKMKDTITKEQNTGQPSSQTKTQRP